VGETVEVLPASAEGKEPVRRAAEAGAEDEEVDAFDGFLLVAVFKEPGVADFLAGCVSELVDWAAGLDCEAGEADAEDAVEEEAGRLPRIFGRTKIAPMTRAAATIGTT
jgi:hypothetical protein